MVKSEWTSIAGQQLANARLLRGVETPLRGNECVRKPESRNSQLLGNGSINTHFSDNASLSTLVPERLISVPVTTNEADEYHSRVCSVSGPHQV
jgi:hypothetical protein